MREVLTELIQRWERGETSALATVVRTFRAKKTSSIARASGRWRSMSSVTPA